jgi:filamentous hemagglutinin family protein
MRRRNFALPFIALAIGAMPWPEALANPTGPTPVRGVAGISGLGTSSVTVNTNNAKAIINWQGFSIGGGETTRFTQPSAASAVLNRVISTQASSILGALQSNGRVFLINPNGIFFGGGATVDVAGLVASSLNLSNHDFISGRLRFTETPGAGQVETSGLTRAPVEFGGGPGTVINAPGGFVYLVAPSINIGGGINATEVILAAAKSVEIINPGTPDVTVNISAGPGNTMRHFGAINGGRINMFAGVLDISGGEPFGSAAIVSASTAIAGADGTVTLRATGDINVGPEGGFFSDGPRIEASKRVTMIADGNINMSCPECQTDAPALVQGGDIFFKGNNITQGENASLLGTRLTIAAGGDVDLGNFSNSVARFGGRASGDVIFNNTSLTLKVNGLRVEPSHSLSLTQHGDLEIKGDVTSGTRTISATGKVLVTPGRTDGIIVHATGPQSIESGGDLTIQGGRSRDAFALVSSSDNIDLTVGGTLRLNSGSVPQGWARVQTEDRDSTITLHFPNLSSGGWLVNGSAGAIRQGQSGFLSGNGAAVLGRTLIVDYGP